MFNVDVFEMHIFASLTRRGSTDKSMVSRLLSVRIRTDIWNTLRLLSVRVVSAGRTDKFRLSSANIDIDYFKIYRTLYSQKYNKHLKLDFDIVRLLKLQNKEYTIFVYSFV